MRHIRCMPVQIGSLAGWLNAQHDRPTIKPEINGDGLMRAAKIDNVAGDSAGRDCRKGRGNFGREGKRSNQVVLRVHDPRRHQVRSSIEPAPWDGELKTSFCSLRELLWLQVGPLDVGRRRASQFAINKDSDHGRSARLDQIRRPAACHQTIEPVQVSHARGRD